jgi:transcriptional regulator with XRE-family HTH domain
MTQTALGEVIGVSYQQIQKYEKGTNRVPTTYLWQFAQILDVPFNDFYPEITWTMNPADPRYQPILRRIRTQTCDRG